MGRILSVDYGKKRTGIAVTDPLQIIASGLVTVATSDLFSFLTDYVNKEPVDCIVVGKPVQLNGAMSENWGRIESFANRWKKSFPNIPLEFFDERFTSSIAQQTILSGGVKKKERRENKGLVDEISATIILQDYMRSKGI